MSDCLSSLTLSAPTCSLLELITIGQYYQPILGYHTLVLSEKCIFQYNKNSFNPHFSAVLTHQYQLGFLTLYFLPDSKLTRHIRVPVSVFQDQWPASPKNAEPFEDFLLN